MAGVTPLTIMGLVIGGGVVFLSLSKYDGLFDDRQVFLGFFIGIIGGAFFGFLHSSMDYMVMGDVLSSLLVLVLLFPVVQTMFKVVVLRRPSIVGKFDAVFSGISLGGGEGAFIVVYILYFLYFILYPEISPGFYDYIVMVVVASSYVLVSSAAGMACGFYSFTGDRMWAYMGFFVHALYYLVVWTLGRLNLVALASGFLFSIFIFIWIYNNIEKMMPSQMEREIRRQVRADRRKEKKGEGREREDY